MKTRYTIRIGFALLVVMLELSGLVAIAWAQPTPGLPTPPRMETPPVPPSEAWPATLVFLGIALLLIVALAKGIDRKRKRGNEAVWLQAQISDALLRERSLASLPLTAIVQVPTWTRAPATIEMHGQVPTPQHRDAVLRIAEQEASRMRSDFRIDDRIRSSHRRPPAPREQLGQSCAALPRATRQPPMVSRDNGQLSGNEVTAVRGTSKMPKIAQQHCPVTHVIGIVRPAMVCDTQ